MDEVGFDGRSESDQVELDNYPFINGTIQHVNEVLSSPRAQAIKESDPVLGKSWIEELSGNLRTSAEQAAKAGREFADVLQFARGNVSTDTSTQTEDDRFADEFMSAFGAKAVDSEGKGYLVDSGLVIKAMIEDPNFPRITPDQFRNGDTPKDGYVVAEGDEIKSVGVPTRIPDVQLVLHGAFPKNSSTYSLQPGLRIAMKQSA